MCYVRSILISLAIISLAACTKSEAGQENRSGCSDLNLRVFNGEQCSVSSSPVVSLTLKGEEGQTVGTCSGTLITRNDVLTAAHCLVSDEVIITAVEVFTNGAVQDAQSAYVHPRYDNLAGSPFDIGIVSVANDFPVAPMALLLSSTVEVGQKATVYGYGLNGEFSQIRDRLDLRAARVEITGVSAGFIQSQADKTNTSVCPGDSGGAMAVVENDRLSLVGVTSLGVLDPSQPCRGTLASAFINMSNAANFNFVFDKVPDAAVR